MGVHAGSKTSNDSLYNYHVCTSSGTFLPSFSGNIEVLVVAGGGGGGMDMGGGGGGGGVLTSTAYAVTSGTGITVTVGAGGAGAPGGGSIGQNYNTGHQYSTGATNGGNSVFGSLTAIGGGYGGSSYFDHTLAGYGNAGGSGGGASGYSNGSSGRNGAGTAGQGNNGGTASGQYYSGGGGGAGAAGASGSSQADGGAGILNSILGVSYYWAGGGGGAAYSLSNGGNGGIGGGGGGAVGYTTGGAGLNPGNPGGGGRPGTHANCHGGNAGRNTGGGGGAGTHYRYNNHGGNGGSGIVIIRYLKSLGTSTFSSGSAEQKSSLVFSFDAANLGKSSSVEVLVVAGGGGSGMDMGGGGGGGGVIYNAAYSTEINSAIPVIIGGGGAGAPNQYYGNPSPGSSGTNTVFGKLNAIGGGGGGSGHREPPWGGSPGQVGGSGGGDSAYYSYLISLRAGYDRSLFDTTQGYPGGRGSPNDGYHAGGGGGASQPGGGGGNTYAGNGGQGFLSAINGTSLYWGGGGGGSDHGSVGGNGGAGGGGGGSAYAGYTAGSGGAGLNAGGNGTAGYSATGGAGGTNTGGGGGGSSHSGSVGAAGGSGIVIVRYYGAQKATGGTITSAGGYTVHTFTSSGTFTPTEFIGAKDLSASSSAITVNGATSNSDAGGNYVFNGTSNYIQTALTGTFSQISFEFWSLFDDPALSMTSRDESILGDWNSNRIHFGTRWSVGMHWNVNSVWEQTPGTNVRYGWNHYVLVWNNNTNEKKVYINGLLSSSNATNGNITLGDFRIGVATTLNMYYRGKISNFSIYDRSLSEAEVQQNYNGRRGRFMPGTYSAPALNAAAIKKADPSAPDGNYWYQPPGYSTPILLYTNFSTAPTGKGYVLVGRGRESLDWWNTNGQNTSTLTFDNLNINTSVATCSNDFINRLIGENWNLMKMLVNRLNSPDSWYFQGTTSTTFSWAYFAQSASSVSASATQYSGIYKTGSTLMNWSANVHWTDTLNYGGGNNCDRIFTWSWGGHGSYQGWSGGSSCTPTGSFQNGGEGHALQLVNCFIEC